ncbi:MAG: AraC family transcriptional regulator [Bacteroidota bacterium]
MVTKLQPEAFKVYFINQPTMFHILHGVGTIEVDFKPFLDWEDKLIFLEKGQYIKFTGDDFIARKITFDDDKIFQNKDFRVLFKHLISLGYINFQECEECQQYLDQSIFSNPEGILDISSKQWFWQNPFNANTDEYHVIFDIKEVIDQNFHRPMSNGEIVSLIEPFDLNPQSVFSEKVGITIKKMFANKRMDESVKSLAYSNKSIKEISYELGYNDPAYFTRVFNARQGTSPHQFRESLDHDRPNQLISDLHKLISSSHEQYRNAGHYADQLNMSVKTLSRKVRKELQTSIGQLIRMATMRSARKYLMEGHSIKDISRMLHFEEPNHFTHFFKQYQGITPSDYQKEKVQD